MKIALLFRNLRTGGAESQFAQIAEALALRGHEVHMMTFLPGGVFWDWLESQGHVHLSALFEGNPNQSLGPRTRLKVVPRLHRRLQEIEPDVFYSSNPLIHLVAWGAMRGLPNIHPVWGVRSMMPWEHWNIAAAALAAAPLSRRVPAMVYNSRVSIPSWRRAGYRPQREVFIPNGVDTAVFRPSPGGRRALREAWGVGDEETLLGMVARFAAEKDHVTAVKALARVLPRHPELRVAMIGPDRDLSMEGVRQLATELNLEDRFLWIGPRRDLPEVYSALDGSLLTSWAEGFPNTVLESMSCGTPVCSTAAGEAPYIIGDHGVVVPPRDVDALADGIERFLPLLATGALGRAARLRAQEMFSIERLVLRTEALLADPRGCPLDPQGVPVVDTVPHSA
ncbi:MAG: glycosyltransferase [Deltaproteobacteria bacterium]|nr:glycosyltransferase [Deltaproteobacteria bacterium]